MRLRPAVSTYLQTFILVGVALAGSALVVRATSNYQATASGPSVLVQDLSIRQGARAGVVRFLVSNTGPVAVSSFTVLNPGVSALATYCYSAWSASTMVQLVSTCPTLSTNPGSFFVVAPIPPGGGVQVDILLPGTPYVLGRAYSVLVEAVPASQSSQVSVAVPA